MTDTTSIKQHAIGDTRWHLTVIVDSIRAKEFKEWIKENCPTCYCRVKHSVYNPYNLLAPATKKKVTVYELRGGNPADAVLIRLYWL